MFRASHTGGLITRTFTASDWDHVAMVLKFANERDEVFLLEAVGGDIGVRLNKW